MSAELKNFDLKKYLKPVFNYSVAISQEPICTVSCIDVQRINCRIDLAICKNHQFDSEQEILSRELISD